MAQERYCKNDMKLNEHGFLEQGPPSVGGKRDPLSPMSELEHLELLNSTSKDTSPSPESLAC